MKKQKLGSGVGYGRRTLKVEHLEGRAMLAGNVSVSVSGGNLIITGDNHDNAVLVQQGPQAGDYVVTGFDFSDFGGAGAAGPTTIRGGQATFVDFGGTSARVVHGVRGSVIIDLKGGNDSLGVGNNLDDLLATAQDCGFALGFGSGSGSGSGSASGSNSAGAGIEVDQDQFVVPKSLIISMGNGNNNVATVADVQGSEVITGGNNIDNVAVGVGAGIASGSASGDTDAEIGGGLTIVTLNGNDNVCVNNAEIGGAMAVNAGNGNNRVSAEDLDAASISVVTGRNNDVINLANFGVDTAVVVSSGDGADDVSLDDFNAGANEGPNGLPAGIGSVIVNTGGDSRRDFVSVTNFFVGGTMVITTGGGNDEVDVVRNNLSSVQAIDNNSDLTGTLVINTGTGNDSVFLGGALAGDAVQEQPEVGELVITGNLVVVLGTGNDLLQAGAVSVFQNTNGVGGNATVDAGTGNDTVDVFDSVIDSIFTVLMGTGNDTFDLFTSSGPTSQAKLIADGGPGHDTFNNDLGITSNGNFDSDGDGTPDEIIHNWESFNSDDLSALLAAKRKGW